MKVKELIKKLKKFDPEIQVSLLDEEQGYGYDMNNIKFDVTKYDDGEVRLFIYFNVYD